MEFLCNDVPHLRVSDEFTTPEPATDFLEYQLPKLQCLVQHGRESFRTKESNVRSLLDVHATI